MSVPPPNVAPMTTERTTYADASTLLGELLNAFEAEIRGGRTEELKAATVQARARMDQMLYRLTDRTPRPAEPDDDPLLPKKRRHV